MPGGQQGGMPGGLGFPNSGIAMLMQNMSPGMGGRMPGQMPGQMFQQNAARQGINTSGPQLGQGMPAQMGSGAPMSQGAARAGIMSMLQGGQR